MTDLSPGQEVTVNATGASAEVVYMRGSSVRIRMTHTGKGRTVPLKAVTPKRESKALSVSAEELAAARQLGMRHPSVPNPLTRPMERAVLPVLRPVPKPVTLRSESYLAYVRKHPCCLCGASPSEAHHWSHHGGVMGAKVDDYRTVPLCTEHHRYWHDHGTLPGRDLRQDCEWLFVREQRHLIHDWIDGNGTAVADGDIVDALIRAIGVADA